MKYKRKVKTKQKTRTFVVENPNKQKPEQNLKIKKTLMEKCIY